MLSTILLIVIASGIQLLLVIVVIVRLPSNYFLDPAERQLWIDHHPLVRFALLTGKNLLGLVLIALGLVLTLPGIPGQGILTMLLGIMCIDFPGKRRWEIRLVSLPRVLRTINAWRKRAGRPPLQLPHDASDAPTPRAPHGPMS